MNKKEIENQIPSWLKKHLITNSFEAKIKSKIFRRIWRVF